MKSLAVLVPANSTERLQEIWLSQDEVRKRVFPQDPENVVSTLLLRPCEKDAGLFAFHYPTEDAPNILATRLAMACGLFAYRFRGAVILTRSRSTSLSHTDLHICDVEKTCHVSPDLRPAVLRELGSLPSKPIVPTWLASAAKNNYHDVEVLEKLASVFQTSSEAEHEEIAEEANELREGDNHASPISDLNQSPAFGHVTAIEPLCIHCRKVASRLCVKCEGVYFCKSDSCLREGWSHECLCPTFRLYTCHRKELNSTGISWSHLVTGREFQLSDQPFEHFLLETLHVDRKEDLEESWWRTEFGGWMRGASSSAQSIDVTKRQSFAQGFFPLTITEIPPQRPVTLQERDGRRVNEVGLLKFSDWPDYLSVRGLSLDSPAVLLLSFPLTMYHAIATHGVIPCTVARIMERPIRIHVVGAEKELKFLDLFLEVLYLLPEDLSLDLVFCVRADMLPTSLSAVAGEPLVVTLAEPKIRILVVGGSYGDSIDPNFDCGSIGAPDMVMAFNAGLYAYPSWRSVLNYLDTNPGVVGVFTDYNEFSAVQCASLGGAQSRNSVRMNPFRQPRAMPVFSMNLPQFSNGFMYVFNEQ